jgi:hypothetical protein
MTIKLLAKIYWCEILLHSSAGRAIKSDDFLCHQIAMNND